MSQSGAYLKTVDRALQVLLQFDKEQPEWSGSELSAALGIHRSIVYRILKSLERRGFVVQTGRQGRFSLGLKLVELGSIVLDGLDLGQVARPVMRRLVKETGESAFLLVVSDDQSVCVLRVDSRKALRAMTNVGDRSPLHAGASSKVLLAYLDPEKREALIARGFERITPLTITNQEKLRADLAQIRKQGWAYTVGELTPYVAAIAAPLWDSSGELRGGLSIAGPASRFSEDRLQGLIDYTIRAGEEISAQLLVWQGSSETARP